MSLQRQLQVFLYGTFMDTKVLAQRGVAPRKMIPARLKGWRIGFTPYANIVPDEGSEVWGLLRPLSFEEMDHLYGRPLFDDHIFLPRRVVVETSAVELEVLTYVCEKPIGVAPDKAYLHSLRVAAERHGLPTSYITKSLDDRALKTQ